jgi:hypothetical protein
MTRKLKALAVATVVLGTLSVITTSAAASPEFHCSVEPCRITAGADGTGNTAHHVVVVTNFAKTESISTTCNAITAEATSNLKTTGEIQLTNITGETCKLNGSPAEIVSNGCAYVLKAAGTLTITCPPGKVFENHGFGGTCSYNFPPQGPISGVSFHNLGNGELTVSMSVHGIVVTTTGECWIKEAAEASITTGNLLLTGETSGGTMANLWWE